MPLPEINITFSSLATSAVERSQRGIVALILKDDTGVFTEKIYTSVTDVLSADWTAANLQYIKDAFLGIPSKVIVERLDVAAVDYSAALAVLALKRWNYLAIPGIIVADVATISTWLIDQRTNVKKTYRAVLPSSASDNEGVINFTTAGIVVGAKTYSASDYTARIAGILAGLPLTRSATHFVLSEVDSITDITVAAENTAIDAGELILINDGEKVKIARGVNSLKTITAPKTEDWKKIKIIEGHDLIRDDITNTFNDDYVGEVVNSYDNQAIFITALNAYLRTLKGDVLDPNAGNTVDVNIAAQRTAIEGTGTDTSTWTDQKVKEFAFQSKVFLIGSLKFLDAMEDLTMEISV
jgi:hypothetical protein